MGREWLVSTSWLADHLADPDLRIVEIGAMGPAPYPDGHIPGAIFWPWKESLWAFDRRDFLSPMAFADLMAHSGVSPQTTLVLYSEELQFATYTLWTCLLRGHRAVRLLDGGRARWLADGHPLSTAVPAVTRTHYPGRAVDETGRMRRDDVLAGLGDGDRILLDARSPEEYRGERVMPGDGFDHGAERKGRIPGARHLYYRELLNDDDTFRPSADLRAAFAARGALPERDLVVYCRLSHRATLVWFTARLLLEYPHVRSYDGSWTEWGSMVGMPIDVRPLPPAGAAGPQAGGRA